VLRTYDFGDLDGVHFISMEYVRGVTLRYMLDSTDRLPFSAGLRVAKQLCAGLAAAHAQGVIHRDIKPDNLILDQAGNAKLMDFGIARPVVRQTGLTREGWIVGTPQFMSPEQLEGREVDARSDVYACGVVLYEIFTGRLPFTADSPMQIVFQHLNQEPPPPSQIWREIPPDLEQAILTCLAKKPENRFPSVERLQRALEALSA
jgi:serine/threonine-protein kinase